MHLGILELLPVLMVPDSGVSLPQTEIGLSISYLATRCYLYRTGQTFYQSSYQSFLSQPCIIQLFICNFKTNQKNKTTIFWLQEAVKDISVQTDISQYSERTEPSLTKVNLIESEIASANYQDKKRLKLSMAFQVKVKKQQILAQKIFEYFLDLVGNSQANGHDMISILFVASNIRIQQLHYKRIHKRVYNYFQQTMKNIIKKVLAIKPNSKEQQHKIYGHYGPPASISHFPKEKSPIQEMHLPPYH